MNAELIVKLVPEEIRFGYNFSRQGIVKNSGKFEGETIATLYYYDCFLNGGDTVFEITDEEREAFGIGSGYKAAYLYESDNGFVHLYFYSDMSEAEQAQNEEYNDDEDLED